MRPLSGGSASKLLRALLWVCVALLTLAAVRAAVAPVGRLVDVKYGTDFDTFYFGARAVYGHDRSFYDHKFLGDLAQVEIGRRGMPIATAPPFSLLPFIPLSHLSLATARLVWYLFSLLTLIGVFLVLHQGLSPRPPPGSRLSRGISTAIFAGLALVLYLPIHRELEQDQTNLLMLLLLASVHLLVRSPSPRREMWAGLLLAIAILSKVYPAVVLPVLLATGRWRTAAWALATAPVLILLTLPLTGWSDYARYPGHLLGSFYFGKGSNVLWNLSFKHYWVLLVEIAGPRSAWLRSLLRPLTLLPLTWVYWRAWREHRLPLREEQATLSFQARYWQACLLIGTVMASYWEYHMVFALGAFLLVLHRHGARDVAAVSTLTIAGLCFLAGSIDARADATAITLLRLPMYMWARGMSLIGLALLLEWIALRETWAPKRSASR